MQMLKRLCGARIESVKINVKNIYLLFVHRQTYSWRGTFEGVGPLTDHVGFLRVFRFLPTPINDPNRPNNRNIE